MQQQKLLGAGSFTNCTFSEPTLKNSLAINYHAVAFCNLLSFSYINAVWTPLRQGYIAIIILRVVLGQPSAPSRERHCHAIGKKGSLLFQTTRQRRLKQFCQALGTYYAGRDTRTPPAQIFEMGRAPGGTAAQKNITLITSIWATHLGCSFCVLLQAAYSRALKLGFHLALA